MSFLIPEEDERPERGHQKRKKLSTKRKKSIMDKLVSEWNDGMLPQARESDESEGDDGDIFDEKKPKKSFDEEILSEGSEEEIETAQEKRLRMAKQFLDAIEKEEQDRSELKEVSKETIAHRLKEEVLEQQGKLYKWIAEEITGYDKDNIKVLRGHKLPVTCHVISPDNRFIFSASKDCSIIKWCVETCKKVKVIHGGRKGTEDRHIGHTAHVLSLAVCTDGKFLVSGCQNGVIHIWDPETMELLKTFKQHKGAITGLTFQRGTHQLFSASADKSVKTWNLDEMAFVETLYGHTDAISGIDGHYKERAITAGGRDCSVRVWKILEESQLVFSRAGNTGGAIDCVRSINDNSFITGGDDGMVHLWSIMKKHPLNTRSFAHGHNPENKEPHWITAVATLVNTDISASGSMNGKIRLYRCSRDFKTLELLFDIPDVPGFVNSLQFSGDGQFVSAGVGQEHRLGRWWRIKEAKNCLLIIPFIRATLNGNVNGTANGDGESATDGEEDDDSLLNDEELSDVISDDVNDKELSAASGDDVISSGEESVDDAGGSADE